MPTQLRRLGVHGKNAPTKKSKTVTASDFAIAGLIGKFERKYLVPFEVKSPTEEQEIFGNYVSSSTYAKDVMKTFWDNLAGTRASMWIKSHVGYTGSAYDAVVALRTIVDQNGSPASTLKIESAYKGTVDYGISGNRTATKVINGFRYSTTVSDTIGASDLVIKATSVIGIKIGDMVKITLTPSGAIYRKVTAVDESLGTFTIATVTGAVGAIADTIDVLGFQLKTYRKSLTGLETEVETALGLVWCTMEPEVTDYYVCNIHSQNKWIKVTDLASASTLNLSFPATDALPIYCASGADGTAPTTSAHWAPDLTAFDGLPVRMISNPETITTSVHKAGEAYCKARTDTPFWFPVLQANQSSSQLKVIGSSWQRSDDVFAVLVAEWLKVSDPYNVSPIAPDRQIPNVGAVMGSWIRSTATLGIHFIPAVDQITLLGINGVVNDVLGENVSDDIRTDIAQYGVNIIQFVDGSGFRIRNFFTPSTDSTFMFSNGLMMRNFFKISSEQSLKSSENTPNSFNRIKENRDAIKSFFYKMWFKGSTNNIPVGETFGQQENADGSLTVPEDHFEVVADAVNNPLTSINAGNRNIDAVFTFPTPAGSIEINVGILIR